MLIPFRLPQLADLIASLRPTEIFYIGGPIPLPAPLTAEEERALLTRLPEEGERVRQTLIERHKVLEQIGADLSVGPHPVLQFRQ